MNTTKMCVKNEPVCDSDAALQRPSHTSFVLEHHHPTTLVSSTPSIQQPPFPQPSPRANNHACSPDGTHWKARDFECMDRLQMRAMHRTKSRCDHKRRRPQQGSANTQNVPRQSMHAIQSSFTANSLLPVRFGRIWISLHSTPHCVN